MNIATLLRKSPRLFRVARTLKALYIGISGLLVGRHGALDHIRSSYSMALRATNNYGRPVNITIEPTNTCNLRCPVCETGAGILGRPAGQMSFDQFVALIDKIADHTNTLMFYFMGESFLNKDAYRMIRYAKAAGIPFITSCTNGDFIDPTELVDSGIDEISFQIGGMTQATHEVYRINSQLEQVLKNLQQTINIKSERRPTMKVQCGFILMKHNEHELSAFRDKMAELGVDDAIVIDPCVRTIGQARQMLPTDRTHWYYDPNAFEQGVLTPRIIPQNECPWLYYAMTVQVNGDVVPCCRDTKGEWVMGNVFTQDVDDIWNGKKFQTFRKRLHNNQQQIGICRLCSGYGVSSLR